ncbi:hypothetical protein AHAS_Ahas11G0275500 [Arachis hypogaea]
MVGFGHAVELMNFMFDNSLISVFVERWRTETHTFHLLWGDVRITLQDVAYHLGLRTRCVEDLLGDRPPPQPEGGKQVFDLRMTWLRDRVSRISVSAYPDTLCKYARCYLMMLIGGFFSQTSLLHLFL